MKFLFIFLALSYSVALFSQVHFKVSSDKQIIKNLNNYKKNHLLILTEYEEQIDSEIQRLVSGIEHEIEMETSDFRIKAYEELLIDLIIKRVFIRTLQAQLQSADLDAYTKSEPRKDVFDTDDIIVDLSKEMNIHLDSALKESPLEHYFIKDLKSRLINGTIFNIAVRGYRAVGSGLLTKVITQGAGNAALKTTLLSLGSELFTSAARGTVIAALTFPLRGSRLPPESVWLNILDDHPELIINPEWMKYAGSDDEPWSTHSYALLRRTHRMEEALARFLENEEEDFQERVILISKLEDFIFKPVPHHIEANQANDATLIHKDNLILNIAPFWAAKRK
jgi:hypothetical protein